MGSRIADRLLSFNFDPLWVLGVGKVFHQIG